MNESLNENLNETPKNNLYEIVVETMVNESMDEIEFLDHPEQDEYRL